ncbi:hypothetical protein HMPREF0183_2228 [Brevibacterium mcbrellneri ATCC 49030]|uniref:Uncharacterized protein n=1 Tax=Brevibacterium mcbrellneri ATCC 49030 TaxID=585530 RepID=D4YQL8_9MICO|nr:hypothetical protein HMPREF0183_2228 [Brevibacterium mcbrellneri ATCC 49030]
MPGAGAVAGVGAETLNPNYTDRPDTTPIDRSVSFKYLYSDH